MIKHPQELEQLSAYLDDELSPAERRQLETRLQQDPALAEELESLRQTVALVQQLPIRKAPRSFALTPAMLAEKPIPAPIPLARKQPARPPIRWSVYAPLAAVLMVALVGVGLFLRMSGSGSQESSNIEAGTRQEIAYSSDISPEPSNPVSANTIFVTEVALAQPPTHSATATGIEVARALPTETPVLKSPTVVDEAGNSADTFMMVTATPMPTVRNMASTEVAFAPSPPEPSVMQSSAESDQEEAPVGVDTNSMPQMSLADSLPPTETYMGEVATGAMGGSSLPPPSGGAESAIGDDSAQLEGEAPASAAMQPQATAKAPMADTSPQDGASMDNAQAAPQAAESEMGYESESNAADGGVADIVAQGVAAPIEIQSVAQKILALLRLFFLFSR